MYSVRSPLDFEMNLFEGSVCSEAVRRGVLAGRAVNPAAANRSSWSATRCVSVSQLQRAMQAERHATRRNGEDVGESGWSMPMSLGLFGSPAAGGKLLKAAIDGTAGGLSGVG